jgi:hypothetical protein
MLDDEVWDEGLAIYIIADIEGEGQQLTRTQPPASFATLSMAWQ